MEKQWGILKNNNNNKNSEGMEKWGGIEKMLGDRKKNGEGIEKMIGRTKIMENYGEQKNIWEKEKNGMNRKNGE